MTLNPRVWVLFAGVAWLTALGLVSGCRSGHLKTDHKRFEFQRPHMGTLFAITLYARTESEAQEASVAAFEKIASLERIMTDYDPESELMQVCRRPVGEPTRVSDDLFNVLQQSQHLARLSNGAFDVTIGPVVRLWRRARRTKTMPDPATLTRALEAVGYEKLKLDPGNKTVTLTVPNMQLDLGGIGKGYAADQALKTLKRMGISRALVAASGDIAVSDSPPGQRGWRVGIGALNQNDQLAENLLLRNSAVSTSGDTEQFVEIQGRRYSHIVDPRTGLGRTERLQVSVIAKNATDTDSFGTTISVLGAKRGLALVESQPRMAAIILRQEGDQTQVFESRRFRKIPRAGTESLAR